MKFNILIKFKDGTEKIITDATEYGANNDNGCFYVIKNGYRQFIPKENVLYIGREFDLKGGD